MMFIMKIPTFLDYIKEMPTLTNTRFRNRYTKNPKNVSKNKNNAVAQLKFVKILKVTLKHKFNLNCFK